MGWRGSRTLSERCDYEERAGGDEGTMKRPEVPLVYKYTFTYTPGWTVTAVRFDQTRIFFLLFF